MTLKIGLQLGYWGAQPPVDLVGTAQEAERLGYDSVWTAEAWGSDAFTPLAWIGASTSKVRLGRSYCWHCSSCDTGRDFQRHARTHEPEGAVNVRLWPKAALQNRRNLSFRTSAFGKSGHR